MEEISLPKVLRDSVTEIAENAGINSNHFYKIDSIVNEAIQKQMTPSAQVLVARNGTVVYNKKFWTLYL